jgi:hypothetical protein
MNNQLNQMKILPNYLDHLNWMVALINYKYIRKKFYFPITINIIIKCYLIFNIIDILIYY